MESIWQARRSLERSLAALALAIVLAIGWLAISAASPAAPLQQETPSPSPSPSLSPTPSLTPSPSISPTITATLPTSTATVTPSPVASPSATSTLPFIASPTWTEAPAPTEPLAIPAPLEPGPSATPAGPTPTLLPLPSVTYQYPQVAPTGQLLLLSQPTEAQALPKGRSLLAANFALGRGWFLWLILLLWTGLAAWFVVTQILARRR